MVYKIYKSNNYIVVIDENDNYFEEHCATVLVTKNLTPDTTYTVTFFRPESTPQAFYNIPFADIRQQSGAPYASVAAWETWYTTNTGLCNNTAVLNSILATLQAQTDVEGVFVKDLGNSDKIVLQVKVWDQDSQTYIATYYYNPDGSLYTPVGPLEWVGTAGSVNATIVNPLGDITACSDAVAVTLCSGQAAELFDQGITLDNILTELTTGTLDVNITNSTLAVTQSGAWTVGLDAATLLALETITVDQGTSPWIISATALDIRTLTCTDQVSLCNNGLTVDSSNPLPVDAGALTPSADGVGMYGSTDGGTNWTAVQVDTNGVVSTNSNIVGPLGNQDCDNSVAVSLCTAQALNLEDIKTAVEGTLDVNIVQPNLAVSLGSQVVPAGVTGDLSAFGPNITSITFQNIGTAVATISVDGGSNFFPLAPGTVINLDPRVPMGYYNGTSFYWDTTTVGASLLIIYNYI